MHAKIHEKYKGQVVFPKDFIWKLERHKDATVDVSMCARAYRTSKRVQQRGIHKFRGVSVSLEDDDVARTYLILVVDGIDFVWGRLAILAQRPRISFRSFLP
jgi:hypothetical protein